MFTSELESERDFELTECNCVIDAEAAEDFLNIPGVEETISLDYDLERFWSGIKWTIYIYFFPHTIDCAMKRIFLKKLRLKD